MRALTNLTLHKSGPDGIWMSGIDASGTERGFFFPTKPHQYHFQSASREFSVSAPNFPVAQEAVSRLTSEEVSLIKIDGRPVP